jgi:hypothetical protein
MMPVVHFLRDYFRFIDTLSKAPQDMCYRQTEHEFAECAIHAFHHIRNRISVSEPIVVGSSMLCPIPWAIFGTTLGVANKMVKHHFVSPQRIFDHYDACMWTRGYNIVRIARPLNMKPSEDPLVVLADIYGKSVNYILGTCLLLTADIIKNSGPDCNEFRWLFTNSKHQHDDDFSAWLAARNTFLDRQKFDFGELWVKAGARHSNTSQRFCYLPQRYPSKPETAGYWDVEIADVFSISHADLTHGETVEYYGDPEPPKQQMLLLPAPEGYKDLSQADLSDENDQELDDLELQAENAYDRFNDRECWAEAARGYADELTS